MKIFISFVLLLFAININSAPEISRQRITMQQAEALVSIVMWHGTKNNPCVIFTPKDFGISDEKLNSKRFIDFMVGCRNTNGDIFYSIDFILAMYLIRLLSVLRLKTKT
jgi:hypothetical protein